MLLRPPSRGYTTSDPHSIWYIYFVTVPKCDDSFTKAFAKAESKAGAGVCITQGDAPSIEALIDACFDDLKAALSGSPNPPCQRLPATGQTTCWTSSGVVTSCTGTGQDGDFRAGHALSYADNGDGTITDNNTGLMWEKKSDDGTLHDKDAQYTWDDAFAVHIAGLNAGSGFAGHKDWRLPNLKELLSIVNYENAIPSVSPEFNTGCTAGCTVLNCSCTGAASTWTSTTYQPLPGLAWAIDFSDGSVSKPPKGNIPFVRAVRGGL